MGDTWFLVFIRTCSKSIIDLPYNFQALEIKLMIFIPMDIINLMKVKRMDRAAIKRSLCCEH